jgi:hypothetical protein
VTDADVDARLANTETSELFAFFKDVVARFSESGLTEGTFDDSRADPRDG